MRVHAQLQAFKKKISLEADQLNSNITQAEIKFAAFAIVRAFLNPCERLFGDRSYKLYY
jgi:hypothetical protein